MRLLSLVILIICASACKLQPASSASEIELTVVVNTPEPLPPTYTQTIPVAAQTTSTEIVVSSTPNPAMQGNTTACSPRTDMVTYTVVAGDSLSSIAVRTSSRVSDLVEWNCLANANMIVVGMRLQVAREAIPATATLTPTPTQTLTPTPLSLPIVNGPLGVLGADPAIQNAPNWTEYLVVPGTGVTIIWSGIDPQYYAHVGQIQFFYTADGSSAVSIGIDSDKSNGMSITWLIPDGVSGRITARAQYGTGGTIESPAIYLRPQ